MNLSELAKTVSDVHFGIGSDGMILICNSDVADFRMRIFNADGSEGKNCGNGLRCVARFLFDHGYARSELFTIETLGGIVSVQVEVGRGVKVNMGKPRLQKEALPMLGEPLTHTINEPFTIEDQLFHLTCVSMGNPHAIVFVDHIEQFPLAVWGAKIEHAPLFPERVNFGIVQVLGEQELIYRVWERGSGLTKACGTGACAAVVAAILNRKLNRSLPITVHLPGGDLTIFWDEHGDVWKYGPAAYICKGDYEVD